MLVLSLMYIAIVLPPTLSIASHDESIRFAKHRTQTPLHPHSVPQLASLTTYQNCVRLADLNGDGDERFLVADLDRRLKVYKGMSASLRHRVCF